MDRKYNKALVSPAKSLRKNMTREERHLWYAFLQGYDITVLRIPNHEVNYNFQSVCEHIDLLVQQSLSQLR